MLIAIILFLLASSIALSHYNDIYGVSFTWYLHYIL